MDIEYRIVPVTLLQQAAEALRDRTGGSDQQQRVDLALADLYDAMASEQAEPAQEPVGEMRLSEIIDGMVVPAVPAELPVGTKLYAAPQPQRPPLTDEEIDRLWRDPQQGYWDYRKFARAIERKVRGE